MIKIHYLQPYALDLNIGKAYNEALKFLPEHHYACITDHDTLKFPSFANHLQQIMEALPNPINTLLTCKTNRLRMPNAQVEEAFFGVDSILKHQEHAERCWREFGTDVEPVYLAAGCCMVFNIGTALELGGFVEDSIIFDRLLSAEYKNSKRPILLAEGLYIFHLYRYGMPNPAEQINHLKK